MHGTSIASCPWRANRRFYPHVEPAAWEWSEQFLGGDGVTWRVVIQAGGRHSRKFAQSLRDLEHLKSAGFPFRPDPVLVACEDPRTELGCAYWNAHNRFYWSCASAKHRPKTRVPGPLGGKWIEEYVTSCERWIANEHITDMLFAYGDPSDPEWRTRFNLEAKIRAMRKLGPQDRLFHGLIGLPWGRWIGTWVRDMCGEIVKRRLGKPVLTHGKRELLRVGDAAWSHGFCFGLHPSYDCGGKIAAEALQGADPLERILASYCRMHSAGFDEPNIEGCMGMYGIAGGKMDDGRLYHHAGQPGKLAKWPFAGKPRPLTLGDLTEEELHGTLRKMVEGTKELVEKTLVPKRTRKPGAKRRKGVFGLADAIANQVYVLYHASRLAEAA